LHIVRGNSIYKRNITRFLKELYKTLYFSIFTRVYPDIPRYPPKIRVPTRATSIQMGTHLTYPSDTYLGTRCPTLVNRRETKAGWPSVYGATCVFFLGFACLYHRPPPLNLYADLPTVLTIVHCNGTPILSLHNM
jgi:hypothetical protein